MIGFVRTCLPLILGLLAIPWSCGADEECPPNPHRPVEGLYELEAPSTLDGIEIAAGTLLIEGDEAILELELSDGSVVRAEYEIGAGEWVFD